MDLDTNTASALLWALRVAREYGGAEAALGASGIHLPEVDRFEGASQELAELLGAPTDGAAVRAALAVGLLAGRVAHQPPRAPRLQDPTSFFIDRDLVVRAAEGQSILRLPWFDEGLFVGRQLPEISEMPPSVLRLCVENYSAALAGERRQFAFTSYGHAYSVDAVPVQGNGDGRVEAVLAIAVPARGFASAAAAYERTAERLDGSAMRAEQRADRQRLAGRGVEEVAERNRANSARRGAQRARTTALRLRSQETDRPAELPSLTSRQLETVALASHGLTSDEIAEQLGVSEATVKTHFRNIYARLGVSDRSAAVATALRHGLID